MLFAITRGLQGSLWVGVRRVPHAWRVWHQARYGAELLYKTSIAFIKTFKGCITVLLGFLALRWRGLRAGEVLRHNCFSGHWLGNGGFAGCRGGGPGG